MLINIYRGVLVLRREKSNYIIQAVVHALDVLEQFYVDGELGVTELSKRLALHKNNVFRILATLESRGYIEQNKANENYRLDAKCVQLGQRYIKHLGFLRQAKPVMQEVVKASRETVYITVMRHGRVVPVDVMEPEQPVRIVSQLGEMLPLHSTAAGKIHLAFEIGEDFPRSVADSLPVHTPRTITDPGTLKAELSEVIEKGFALEDGEYLNDVSAVAAPIRDHTRTVVGSLAVSGPTYRTGAERLQGELVPLVVKAGKNLSGRLGLHNS